MFLFHINVKSSNLQLYLDSRFIVSRDMLNVATLHFDYILCKTQNRSVYAHQCVSVCVCGGGGGGGGGGGWRNKKINKIVKK